MNFRSILFLLIIVSPLKFLYAQNESVTIEDVKELTPYL
ncbi:unnamed protein product, partial [marine sediment metagenome]